MKRSHKALLILGLALVVVGVLLPLVGLAGSGDRIVAPGGGVPASLWVAFLALAVGIPLSALGCVLAAVAVVAHRLGQEKADRPRQASRREPH